MTPDEAAKKSGISTANWLAARTEVPLVRARAQLWGGEARRARRPCAATPSRPTRRRAIIRVRFRRWGRAAGARTRASVQPPAQARETRVVQPTLDRSLAAISADFPRRGGSREFHDSGLHNSRNDSAPPTFVRWGTNGGRFVTSKAEDYRRRARACLLMAGTIADDETRAALVEMAQVWMRLAGEDAAPAPSGAVAESPPVMQQQQQIQSKKKEE
jgi:hypothetical protein